MAETAVGLFDSAGTADEVVRALHAEGFAHDAIRVLSMPTGMAVEGATSTPSLDFSAALAKDLSAMGATEEECEAYVQGIRGGNLIVFASGTEPEADKAVEIMNGYDPVEIEEFAAAAPMLPALHVGAIGANDIATKQDRKRAREAGARVFTW